MFKFIRTTKLVLRLSDACLNNSTIKTNYFFNNRPIIHSINNQLINNYCTETVKQLPGLDEGIDVEKLTENDPELLKKLQIIILENDVMRQEGFKIPESTFLKQHHWQELFAKSSRSQRKKYLEFLWKVEKMKENKRSKREEAKIERDNRPEYVDDGHIRYGLNHNTFLIRIYDTTINEVYNAKLIDQLQFGQPIVIDCGYDTHMTTRECYNCAKQIMLAFSENRNHEEPFDLHLCNAAQDSQTISALERHIGTMREPWFPLTIHEESYTSSRFPSLELEARNHPERTQQSQEISKDLKKKIVYLTPHCREEMNEFDHEAIYIIGGIVDKVNQEPLSLAKAKREGLKMQKLPLDRYLSWGSGSGKSLTINQMMSILLDIRRTGDWDFALRHVPRRKIMGPNVITRSSDRTALRYDKGARDFGDRDNGGRNNRARDFGGRDNRNRDFGGRNFDGRDFGGRDNGSRDFGARNFDGRDFGGRDNGSRDFGARNFDGQDFGGRYFDKEARKVDEKRMFDNTNTKGKINTKDLIKELLNN